MLAMDAISQAITIAGGSTKLAKAIGISGSYMSQIKTGARPIPAEYCPRIERATSGVVRCEDMRPDVDWAYLRATDCPIKEVD